MNRTRMVDCRGCGTNALHKAKGLCDRCYKASRPPTPRSLARTRWYDMLSRCNDPADAGWHLYGGRGIRVCDRWRTSFDAYYQDVGDAPEDMSLDRVDNDGDYEPDNVRWATAVQQRANRRYDPNVVKTHCPQNHPYDEANTYIYKGKRGCKACRREAGRRYRDGLRPLEQPARDAA